MSHYHWRRFQPIAAHAAELSSGLRFLGMGSRRGSIRPKDLLSVRNELPIGRESPSRTSMRGKLFELMTPPDGRGCVPNAPERSITFRKSYGMFLFRSIHGYRAGNSRAACRWLHNAPKTAVRRLHERDVLQIGNQVVICGFQVEEPPQFGDVFGFNPAAQCEDDPTIC
jgi:hypothetical protein